MKYLLLMFLFSSKLFAFNGYRCDLLMRKEGGFQFFTFLTTSTAQFASSTGECSAIGKTSEQERELFYVMNWEFIKKDIAKGVGENLSSLLTLSGCKDTNDIVLRRQLKENYEAIFSNDIEQSYRYISPILDNYCKSRGRS